jgi:hypothetical protein
VTELDGRVGDLTGRLEWQTGTADSAHNALQLIRKTSPDLRLMGIRLK